ncbi:hypothetical protein MCBMB27_05294 [Methylobacterium phyllosphaerae]|uniref:Uncharacterized protein n=1 Tax=Methylobacterium phyllosphaerae TaxID=418223 RepID=A0AAE8L7L4_9HYPH|nr:hypothetical protein [Methylobacterium phyllosphaerae]APT34585.1 hypothetical protein MCBMB27_05294 [Methylobacterium phyllosphaerae]SFH18692.1 hypothetical protein SAMN05192567_1163 [Methylobacterium phyllosphaerae]
MVTWRPGGEMCPVCRGEGRGSISYPAAICRDCETRLVDWDGRPVDIANTSLIGTGIQVANGEEVVDGDTPIFVDGIACWAREARFGGVVVQPVAGWLSPPFPVATESQRKTLAEFEYDGRAVLDFLIAASPWGSIDQAIASLSVFAHPDVVAATGHRAIFRTVRGRMADRGSIIDGVMVDDNASPAAAFEWSTGLKRGTTRDLTCCHLYASSSDPDAYTDLRNIFYAPSFIAKLTDSQAGSLPVMHALHALRYRAFALHGYCGPGSTARPLKPEHYDSLEWADPVGADATASGLEAKLRARLADKPKDRITKSVAHCGWVFSGGQPDRLVVYSGRL